MKTIVALFLMAFSFDVLGCSFANPFSEFEHSNEGKIIPSKPSFSLSSIRRGEKGDSGSCSDAGILSVKVDPVVNDVGYRFSLYKGEFEDQLFYSATIIRDGGYGDPGEYYFIWLDGNKTEQEPIDIVVKIVAISKDGGESEPQYLPVTHPGVKKPWWKLW